jgi:hypothetical protein
MTNEPRRAPAPHDVVENRELIRVLIGKVEDLEDSSERLNTRINGLTVNLTQVGSLEGKMIEVQEQARLALESSLHASDLADEVGPKVHVLEADALRRSELRSRWLRFAVSIVCVLVATTYLSVAGYANYSSHCLSTAFLTKNQAWVCDHVFFGDKTITPGPQYSGRLSRP